MRQPGMIPHLAEFAAKMAKAGLNPLVIETFAHYYRRLVGGETGLIDDADIRPIPLDEIAKTANLGGYATAGRHALSRAVRIVLNGGLGTPMGLLGPKSCSRSRTPGVRSGDHPAPGRTRPDPAGDDEQFQHPHGDAFGSHKAEALPAAAFFPAAQVPQDPAGETGAGQLAPQPRA